MISLFFDYASILQKLNHGLLVLSFVGLIAGSFLGRIPFISQYGNLIKGLCVLVFVATVFGEGYFYASKSWIEQVNEYRAKVDIAEQQSAEANKNLSLALIARKAEIDASQKIIKDELQKYSSQIDSQCKVDPKAIELINKSAKGNKK